MSNLNIKHTVKGTKLIIEVDLSERFGPSSSGKTQIVGKGSEKVAGQPGMGYSLTVYAKE